MSVNNRPSSNSSNEFRNMQNKKTMKTRDVVFGARFVPVSPKKPNPSTKKPTMAYDFT
jgi:hypothetical protein